ncbi:hypothetical protein OAS86_06825 [Gammaproteobacteria bacterium]|nr:hypothetical protein [Gammaproteobacteria bacterium]
MTIDATQVVSNVASSSRRRLALALLLICATTVAYGDLSREQAMTQQQKILLPPCPESPNCVSSDASAEDSRHHIAAITDPQG